MPTDDERLQSLLDRQAIADVLHYYCRGVDRHDRAALDRVYWPDAFDDHIHVKLPGPAYVEHVLRSTARMRTAHLITNILIEFDNPSSARCESYFIGEHEMVEEGGDLVFLLLSGRYIDRFEKRGPDWRILERTLVFDFQQTLPAGGWDGPFVSRINRRGAHFPDDPLYTALTKLP
jgi:hypothetical protein